MLDKIPATNRIGLYQARVSDTKALSTARKSEYPANLTLGTHPVEITVDEKSVTSFIQIVAATEETTTDPAEAFAPLGDRLVRVWYLDRETQAWTFFDPDPYLIDFSKLTEVKSGQIVTIILTEGDPVEFGSKTLYSGTNPVALD